MKDNLRSFINEHRDAFDNEKPGADLYRRIISGKKINVRRGKFISLIAMRWSAIAASLIIFCIALFIVLKPGSREENLDTNQSKSSPGPELEGTDPIYAIQISQFRQLIGIQQDQLGKMRKDYPELYNQFAGDMASLDSAFRELKKQMENNPNREMFLEAMIENLALQSDLLSRQLLIIRQIKQKSISHEKTRI